jgi:hypothetical protein
MSTETRVKHLLDETCPKIFNEWPWILQTCMVQVDIQAFRWLSSRLWTDFVNQTRHDNIVKECWIMCALFGNVNEATNPIDWPKNWNSALFHVHFLTDLFWSLLTWLCQYQISQRISKELTLIRNDHLVEINRGSTCNTTGSSWESAGG